MVLYRFGRIAILQYLVIRPKVYKIGTQYCGIVIGNYMRCIEP